MIWFYTSGLLVVNSILILWFYSPIANSIGKLFLKRNDIYALDDLLDIIAIKSEVLSTLLSCWVCMSFWLSLIVGLVFMFIFGLYWWYPILTYLTYPSILFAIKQLYR